MTCWVQFINKKEFAKALINENFKTFIVYVEALEALGPITINLF